MAEAFGLAGHELVARASVQAATRVNAEQALHEAMNVKLNYAMRRSSS